MAKVAVVCHRPFGTSAAPPPPSPHRLVLWQNVKTSGSVNTFTSYCKWSSCKTGAMYEHKRDILCGVKKVNGLEVWILNLVIFLRFLSEIKEETIAVVLTMQEGHTHSQRLAAFCHFLVLLPMKFRCIQNFEYLFVLLLVSFLKCYNVTKSCLNKSSSLQ